MNKILNVCLLIVVFTLGVSNLVYGQCTKKGAKGGACIQRGANEFVEDTVYQFQFEFTYPQYEKLLNAYRNDPDFNDYRVAGLGFVPLIDTVSITPLSSSSNQVNYVTNGLRVLLVLWKGQVGSNGQNNPQEIVIFGFGDLGNAFTITAQKSQADDAHFVKLELTGPKQAVRNDSLVVNSREFDIVFLDSLEFEYLARSGDFYPNLERPKDNNNKTIEGIFIERAFGTIDPGSNTNPLLNYRTLVFKPSPLPSLTGYNSEAAVALVYGPHCPPYWIDQTFSIADCNEDPGKCFLRQEIERRKIEIIKIKTLTWLQIIALLVAAIIAAFLGTRAYFKARG